MLVPLEIGLTLALLSIPLLMRRQKAVVLLLVPTLGFLLAAFPARNSDVWLHLATGKLLAQGDLPFGVDPFASTTDGTIWVNHSWLSDLLGYTVYLLNPSMALVLLKALLIAAVGGLLLALGWTRANPGIPAACALLALVVLGQSIPLHPICISCLFLALTLWLLERAGQQPAVPTARPVLRYIPVLILCALWVNLDAWFLLGPLTIALYLVGEVLRSRPAALQDPLQTQPVSARPTPALLGLVLAASLLACLLNPYHLGAFQLPPPLSFLTFPKDFLDDPTQARILFASPFQPGYFFGFGLSASILAYYLLALLSLLSFALNRNHFSPAWALLWIVFFALSAFHTRLIPFFAILAGPCLARNLQDWLAERAADKRRSQPGFFDSLGWERVAVWAGILLLVLAWPGWLQSQPFERRSLELVSDPTLERAAEQFVSWREQGLLRSENRGFNFNVETAHYLAWLNATHGTREKAFLDSRFQLFSPEALLDFIRIREGLRLAASPPQADAPDWRALLRKWQIDRLLLSDGEQANFPQLLYPLLDRPEWAWLGMEGRTALMGWRDPEAHSSNKSDPWAGLVVVEAERGFHPLPSKEAPSTGPGRFPRQPSWSDPFLRARLGRSADRDEAAIHLIRFAANQHLYTQRNEQIVEASLPAALIGAAVPMETPFGPALGAFLGLAALPAQKDAKPHQTASHLTDWRGGIRLGLAFQLDDGPVGSLWQALRAARRAIKANPDDPQAWLLLGETYGRLLNNTRERYLGLRLRQLSQLRHTQAITAFHQAVLLQPDLPQAHWSLALLYSERGWEDLSFKHQTEHLRLTRQRGPGPRESDRAFQDRLARLENSVQKRGEQLKKIESELRAAIAGMKVIDRANTALRARMGGLALQWLLESDLAVFGPEGMALEMELLLSTGQGAAVQEWSTPEQSLEIGPSTYFWLQTLLHASLGDYDQADKDLQMLAPPPPAPIVPGGSTTAPYQDMTGFLVAQALLREVPLPGLRFVYSLPDHLQEIQRLSTDLRTQANLNVLRGVLALEVGHSEVAESMLRRTLDPGEGSRTGLPGLPFGFLARPLAEDYLQRLQASKPSRR